jgi:two-component system NtrC family sensor kinase
VEAKDNKHRIMMVENTESQAVVLRHILEKQDWQVLYARSAEEALEKLSNFTEAQSPDLFIIDFHLPGIQGDELCRRLKMNINTRSIPALMITAENKDESQRRGLESGADDYLPQPIDDDILVLKIKTLLRKSKDSHVLFGIGSSLFQSSRIIAVDNDPAYLDFLEKAFNEDGIQVDRTTGGSEALEKISGGNYDCIMIKMNMPGTGGMEICRKILEMRSTLHEPMMVLMMAAKENKEDMTRALEAGADDFIGKSNDISIIKARLIALLRRKFIQEDNRRIFEELKRKELEVERSRIETSAAEAKAVLAEKLLKTVEQLEEEIDERKRMEMQIKNYSRELERSNRELESFAYVASHDLQEPLRAISSYLQLLDKRYGDKIDDKGKDFIERAVSGAHRMQDMINDLLIYSRITTRGKRFALYSLENILERALTNLSATIERSSAVITRDPMPELFCDETQILRLFQNLISNAVKFCDKSTPNIHLSAKKQNSPEDWLFSVRDNGIGIEAEYKDNIFKIFHRLHSRRKYPGTGIGLAICQKIIERHEGKIWVESQPDLGSTFFFTINTNRSRGGDQ